MKTTESRDSQYSSDSDETSSETDLVPCRSNDAESSSSEIKLPSLNKNRSSSLPPIIDVTPDFEVVYKTIVLAVPMTRISLLYPLLAERFDNVAKILFRELRASNFDIDVVVALKSRSKCVVMSVETVLDEAGIDSIDFKNKFKSNPQEREDLEAYIVMIAVLFVKNLKPDPWTEKYDTIERFCQNYPEFLDENDEGTMLKLVLFANVMHNVLRYMKGKGNQQRLLTLVACLAEGPNHSRYITGGAQSRKTSRRVCIFRKESNTMKVCRPHRREGKSEQKDEYETRDSVPLYLGGVGALENALGSRNLLSGAFPLMIPLPTSGSGLIHSGVGLSTSSGAGASPFTFPFQLNAFGQSALDNSGIVSDLMCNSNSLHMAGRSLAPPINSMSGSLPLSGHIAMPQPLLEVANNPTAMASSPYWMAQSDNGNMFSVPLSSSYQSLMPRVSMAHPNASAVALSTATWGNAYGPNVSMLQTPASHLFASSSSQSTGDAPSKPFKRDDNTKAQFVPSPDSSLLISNNNKSHNVDDVVGSQEKLVAESEQTVVHELLAASNLPPLEGRHYLRATVTWNGKLIGQTSVAPYGTDAQWTKERFFISIPNSMKATFKCSLDVQLWRLDSARHDVAVLGTVHMQASDLIELASGTLEDEGRWLPASLADTANEREDKDVEIVPKLLMRAGQIGDADAARLEETLDDDEVESVEVAAGKREDSRLVCIEARATDQGRDEAQVASTVASVVTKVEQATKMSPDLPSHLNLDQVRTQNVNAMFADFGSSSVPQQLHLPSLPGINQQPLMSLQPPVMLPVSSVPLSMGIDPRYVYRGSAVYPMGVATPVTGPIAYNSMNMGVTGGIGYSHNMQLGLSPMGMSVPIPPYLGRPPTPVFLSGQQVTSHDLLGRVGTLSASVYSPASMVPSPYVMDQSIWPQPQQRHLMTGKFSNPETRMLPIKRGHMSDTWQEDREEYSPVLKRNKADSSVECVSKLLSGPDNDSNVMASIAVHTLLSLSSVN